MNTQKRKVLVTDHAWENLLLESRILSEAGAELVVPKIGKKDNKLLANELLTLVSGVDGILTCWHPVTKELMRKARRCLVVGRYGVGVDNIDIPYATSIGIVVINVPSYCQEEVSDHAMALILSCARKVSYFDKKIKTGEYNLQTESLFRITGKTIGIFGFGQNGKTLYRKAKGFNLNILIFDPYITKEMLEEYDAELVSMEELLRKSDYISIHAPLTSETKHLFNYETFCKMKTTAIVVNTSRGGLIDQQGLLKALDEGEIAGAGLDVYDIEPLPQDHKLRFLPNALLLPHLGYVTAENYSIFYTQMLENLDACVEGKPIRVIK